MTFPRSNGYCCSNPQRTSATVHNYVTLHIFYGFAKFVHKPGKHYCRVTPLMVFRFFNIESGCAFLTQTLSYAGGFVIWAAFTPGNPKEGTFGMRRSLWMRTHRRAFFFRKVFDGCEGQWRVTLRSWFLFAPPECLCVRERRIHAEKKKMLQQSLLNNKKKKFKKGGKHRNSNVVSSAGVAARDLWES